MKFTPLRSDKIAEEKDLKEAYAGGHIIGNVCISPAFLFFRKGFKTFYIAYEDTTAVYRRQVSVEANICCEQGAIIQEYLLICAEGAKEQKIKLPDTKAARILMEELKALRPDYNFNAPKDNK